jgi:release factor glutamine methyltransferase
VKVFELLRWGKNELKRSPSIYSASLDAKLILKHILNLDKTEDLVLKGDAVVGDSAIKKFSEYTRERLGGKPVSKIVHKKFFWKDEFFVNEDVLDPRPETEILIEAVIGDHRSSDRLKILDLGTGSGCIIISLLREFQNADGVAVDISEKSLMVAMNNATRAGFMPRIKFLRNNWNDGLEEKFDIIVSNPPYIETEKIKLLNKEIKMYEPLTALDGMEDGLYHYRYLAGNIEKNCKITTRIYLEIGFGQLEAVKNIFESKGFCPIDTKNDLSGIARVVVFGLK